MSSTSISGNAPAFRPTMLSNYNFCGATWEDANTCEHRWCGGLGSDGSTSCPVGQSCYSETVCSILDMEPGHNDPMNFKFCGVAWEDASLCQSKWCGGALESSNGETSCPEGQSCFADTGCNILLMPPTLEPTSSSPTPLPYDHISNTAFCGSDYMDATNKCSIETHCQSMTNEACGSGSFCWAGVTCNVMDMYTPSPTIDSIKPTMSPIDSQINSQSPTIDVVVSVPSDYFVCGSSWFDASASCKGGRYPRGCPGASNDECLDGDFCWSDTTCNMLDFPPLPTSFPTGTPISYGDPKNNLFCGISYLDAEERCSTETHCPSGNHLDCPDGGYCWSVGCNIADIPAPPPSSNGDGKPTTYDDPTNNLFCGSSYSDAEESCSTETHCPSGNHLDCPNGSYCWDVGCSIVDIVSSLNSSTSNVTTSDSTDLYDDPVNTLFCGSSYSDAEENCSAETHCPSGSHADCSSGGYCWVVACNVMEILNLTRSPSRSPTASVEPSTLHLSANTASSGRPSEFTPSASPVNLSVEPSTLHSSANTVSTGSPSAFTLSASPLNLSVKPSTLDVSANSVSTVSPSAFTDAPLTYTLPAKSILPSPSRTSVLLLQDLIQSVRSSIESDITFIVLPNGAIRPSSLYTYNGFVKGFTFFTDIGVDGSFFYLGAGPSELEIEYGIANLALFLARMMDTIAHDGCDPDFISCGIPDLGRSFWEQSIRVGCSQSLPEIGMECPNKFGCVCMLGILNHFIGAQSASSNNNIYPVYSGVNFCETDALLSICSPSVEYGEELRWIVPMAHWAYFVQPYDVDGWNYADRLRDFVNGGMSDSEFVRQVGHLSVLGAQATVDYGFFTNENFTPNFFRVMTKLRKGLETETAHPTTSPLVTVPQQTLAPSHFPVLPPTTEASIETSLPTTSPFFTVPPQTHEPSNSPESPPTIETTNAGGAFVEIDNVSSPRESSSAPTSSLSISDSLSLTPDYSSHLVNMETSSKHTSSSSPTDSPFLTSVNSSHSAPEDESWYKIYYPEQSRGTTNRGPNYMTVTALMILLY